MITEAVKVVEMLAPAVRTASANGTGVDTQTIDHGKDAMVVLHVGTVTGTTPTLDVKIQDSADNSSWADVSGAAFAQKAAAGLSRMNVSLKSTRRYLRAVATIAGTSPSFPCSVVIALESRDKPVAAQA